MTESDTLRKIQIKHGRGVSGSFKDTTIREWLQQQNPTELEYEKVRTYAWVPLPRARVREGTCAREPPPPNSSTRRYVRMGTSSTELEYEKVRTLENHLPPARVREGTQGLQLTSFTHLPVLSR